MCIGGVRYDLDAEMKAYLAAALDKLAPEVDALAKTYRRNGTILRRTKGVGVLTKDAGDRLRRRRPGRARLRPRIRRARRRALRGLRPPQA